MNTASLRKAALLMSVLLPEHAQHLLALQTPARAAAVRKAMAEVRRHGWAQPAIVEAALGLRLEATPEGDVPGVEELIGLATRIDSTSYARVLAAAQLPDVDFLLSLLEPQYAAQVRGAMLSNIAPPPALRLAVLAAARQPAAAMQAL